MRTDTRSLLVSSFRWVSYCCNGSSESLNLIDAVVEQLAARQPHKLETRFESCDRNQAVNSKNLMETGDRGTILAVKNMSYPQGSPACSPSFQLRL